MTAQLKGRRVLVVEDEFLIALETQQTLESLGVETIGPTFSVEEALAATGYERGTITPFGSTNPWPVIADADLVGRRVSLGGGAHGVAFLVDADEAFRVLSAEVVDVTEPA